MILTFLLIYSEWACRHYCTRNGVPFSLSHSFGEMWKMIRNRMYGHLPYWRVKPLLTMDISETGQWWIEHLTSVDGSFRGVSFNWAHFALSHPDARETTWHVEE